MRFRVSETDEGRSFQLVGELDMSTVSHLTDVLDPRVRGGGEITLDMSELTFMDSTGLQVIIRSALSLGDRGKLILRAPGNLVRSILELAIRTDKIPNLVVEDGES